MKPIRLLIGLLTLGGAVTLLAQTSVIRAPGDGPIAPVEIVPASAVNGAGKANAPLLLPDGTGALPSLAFAAAPTTGISRAANGAICFDVVAVCRVFIQSVSTQFGANQVIGISNTNDPSGGALDTAFSRLGAGSLALGNGTASDTSGILKLATVDLTGPALATAGADVTVTDAGDLTRQRYQATITPATGGAGNCGAAFLAAALTADCTIATLPAGMKLTAIYADVVTITCSGTCTGTKVMQAGTAVAGVQVLAASLNVATTTTYGLADADLGSGLTRAAAIQGGLIGSWASTTPISVRFTSGTGNWGNAATTFVNAGSVKFTLITEQIK